MLHIYDVPDSAWVCDPHIFPSDALLILVALLLGIY